MNKILLIGFMIIVQQVAAENGIHKLTKEQYYSMPPKNHLDPYGPCLGRAGGVYCTAHAEVVADGPNELLDMMKGYSAYDLINMNHTRLVYGLCLTDRCQPFYSGDDDAALWNASEACLNHSLSAAYGLKTRVTELNCNFEYKSKFEKDWLDWAALAAFLGVIALNVIGTVYDVNRDRTKPGSALLTTFSVRVNWKELVAPPPSVPVYEILKPIYGMKAITSLIVVLGHVPIPMTIATDNPEHHEENQRSAAYHLVGDGNVVTMTFFVLSGLMLTYNHMCAKRLVSWKRIPGMIFARWMKLAPITIFTLVLHSTWMRFSSGPLWEEIVGCEVRDCRKYWYNNLLFVNNFYDHSQCLLQTWYLACDMHLHILGLLYLALAPRDKPHWGLLGALFAAGVAWPAYYIVTKNLHPTLLSNPTIVAEFFIKDPTYNWFFKRTYGNMAMYVFGMGFGYLIHDLHQKGAFKKDMTKYRYWYWSLLPAGFAIIATTTIFYEPGFRPSLLLQVLYAPLMRTVFELIIMGCLIGAIYKVEDLYRGVLEWSGWVPVARLGFCTFSIHMSVIRYLGGTRTTLVHNTEPHILTEYFGVISVSLILSVFLYVLVEAPFTGAIGIALGKRPRLVSEAPIEQHINGTVKNNHENSAIKNKHE